MDSRKYEKFIVLHITLLSLIFVVVAAEKTHKEKVNERNTAL